MQRKLWPVVAFVAVLVCAFLLVMPSAQAAPPPPDYRPAEVGPEIRDMEATADRIVGEPQLSAEEAAAGVGTQDVDDCIIDSKFFLTLDNTTGQLLITAYNLLAEDDTAQIWVQANLSWPAGDPRETPVVTCEQASYMLNQFSSNIYPKEIDFFGEPGFHDGSNALLPSLLGLPADYYADETGRQVVLVSNIRDENYYDPDYPLYIAGFYTSAFETYFDRNTMTIDAYDWANRTGPDSARPFLYEGTFAHEYQHLLHDDYDSGEENWINEGMADLAEWLVGYGHPDGHVNAAASNPENSLPVWEDQGDLEILTDYGQAYLFQLYLLEQYGTEFTQALFRNTEHSISGVDSTLAAFSSNRTFADVFHDWSVAMLIDSKFKGGRYEFTNIDFKLDIGTPDDPNPEAFDTPGAPPWGTDYIWITGDPKDVSHLVFNGVPFTSNPTAWTSDGDVLYSGSGNLLDNWAIFEATGGGTLTFDTSYDIEEAWDFGFVQVSTDGGHTWTSLANEHTTSEHDPSAHPKVVENVPGLTGESDWVTMSFDLSAYAGQDILIGFRYVTDWAAVFPGWWIDNVYVDDTLISDGSSTDPFQDLTEILPINNDFTVTFVGISEKKGNGNPYKVLTMKVDEMSESGRQQLNALLNSSSSVVMLVTYDAPEGTTTYADYSYEIVYKDTGPNK